MYYVLRRVPVDHSCSRYKPIVECAKCRTALQARLVIQARDTPRWPAIKAEPHKPTLTADMMADIVGHVGSCWMF